jgi:hypothetical protein
LLVEAFGDVTRSICGIVTRQRPQPLGTSEALPLTAEIRASRAMLRRRTYSLILSAARRWPEQAPAAREQRCVQRASGAAARLAMAAGEAQRGGSHRSPLLSLAAGAALGSAAMWWLGPQADSGSHAPARRDPGDVEGPALPDRFLARLEDTAESMRHAAAAGVHVFMNAGLATKFCAVIGASLPLVLLCGAAYKAAAPATPLSIALAKCFTILFRAPAINEPNAAAWAVAYLTFLAGFFAFSLTLSVVGEGVGQQFQAVRAGRYPVRPDPADHFV